MQIATTPSSSSTPSPQKNVIFAAKMISRGLLVPRQSFLVVSRSLCVAETAPAAASVPKTATGTSDSAANPVGSYYHNLVFRGRGHNALALGDLRKLLQMCNEPKLAKYSLQAVALYQRKGQDFSEEVNSHFIRSVAVEGKQAVAAAKVISKWKNRIGAWGTTTSVEKLLRGLLEQGPDAAEEGEEEPISVAELTVNVLEVSQKKGVNMTKAVFEVASQLVPEEAAAPAGKVTSAPVDEEDGEGATVSESEANEDKSESEDKAAAAVDTGSSSLRSRLEHVARLALGAEAASAALAHSQ